MAKPHHKRKRRQSGPHQQEAQPLVDSQWTGSMYDGANLSQRRGIIQWTTLDTRRELDSYSREELMRKIRWLYANVGFFRGLILNQVRLVGWMTAQSRTKSRDWNRLQEKKFNRRTGDRLNFDRAGKYNLRTAQLMIQKRQKIDGFILTVLTTSEDGTAPAVAFYEAHQLKNPDKAKGDWQEGVLIGKGGRHLAYGLAADDEKVVIVPAASCIYFGAFESPGNVHGISPLAHAINHAIDITEIRADTKHNIKTAAQFGVVKEVDAVAEPTKSKQGMPGVLTQQKVRVSDGEGGSVERRMDVQKIFGGSQAVNLQPGEKLDVLHDSRPAPEQMAFSDELIRDIAVGGGTTSEVTWKMEKLTGPAIRFVMDNASRGIDIEQEELTQWCQKVWWYFTAWEIAYGDLPLPPEGEDWMECAEFLPQRDLTIDRGKDGRLEIELLNQGYSTEADFHRKMTGKSWDDQAVQRIAEIKFKMEECERQGVEYDKVYPPAAGSVQQQPGDEPNPDDEPPGDEKKSDKKKKAA